MANTPTVIEKPVEIIGESMETVGRDIKKQVVQGWDQNFIRIKPSAF